MASITRAQTLSFRVRAQELDRPRAQVNDARILDIGVQDTGPDGGLWALEIRGVDASKLSIRELAMVWTVRGAPHLYRRTDLSRVAVAVEPFSDADAGKRIFDAARPLKAAGIGNMEALDAVAAAMRSVVTKPMVKGEVSTLMTARMDAPYLRFCRSCNATHLYEMTFRLAALRAGLELRPDTSPPVLQRIPAFKRATKAPGQFDVVRAYLRLLGPAAPKHVAEFLDAPLKDVKERWPPDATEVSVDGEKRWLLSEDADRIDGEPARTTRLLGPYDLFLQARDRPLIVTDPARAKALWPVLGRPGAVLIDGEIGGLWRPRTSGGKLTVRVEPWARASAATKSAIGEQAERLAAFRRVALSRVDMQT